jgi:hypothetical protein
MRDKMRKIATLLGPCLLLLALLAPAAGQPADKEGFVPESRPADMTKARVDESIPAAPLVAGAYGFIWAAVLVYVGTVATRTRRLEAEVAALQARLEAGGKGA